MIVDRLFPMEEINGDGLCPTYLYRWTLLATRWFKVYLHHFVGDDWSRDLHDHPKRFISIGLRGAYGEDRWNGNGVSTRVFVAPWIRSFPAEHRHRLFLIGRDCWTLVIVGRSVREWGFWHSGEWTHWETYLRLFGRERKACS